MRKNKRWIAVTALAAVTAAALVTSVVVKNNLNKGPENAITVTQEGTDLGIKQIEALTDAQGNVTGYKVNIDAKGFGETPMELAISFNAAIDTVTGIEVISQNETEGLGSNVTKADFLDQFNGAKLPIYIKGTNVSLNDIVETFSLDSAMATTVAASELNDGTYEVVADEFHNGYKSMVTLTVEGGKITNVVWDNIDENGNYKSVLSQNGEYVMTETGATWAEQAAALAANVIENQGVSALTMNDEGKTDAVASVSISINAFVAQVEEAMLMASKAPVAALNDGTYEVVADEFHNGYKSMVTLTVKGGKITNVVWDNIDEKGNYKSVLSQNGEYVMTETGATWAEQAAALAANVIENQGVAALTMNEEGKTDAVASVSISINDFVAQVEEAMLMASKAPVAVLNDGTYEVVADEFKNGYKSMVTVTVEGGKITNVVWDNIDEKGNYKSVLSQNGEYVMTETGATWAEQAAALAANVIENQGVSALTMNEEGKTDAVASVSISINDFVAQVEEALTMASKAPVESAYIDGTYEIVDDEYHNGYKSMVTLTIEGGKITKLVWDNIDENGNYKSVLSQNGEYVMTETGATWAEQAEALAAHVIANQGLEGLTMNEEGKTDAVASVSISINSFVNQVEKALLLASGQEITEEPTTEEPTTEETGDGTQIDAISGATVTTKAVITAINSAYEYLINNVVE